MASGNYQPYVPVPLDKFVPNRSTKTLYAERYGPWILRGVELFDKDGKLKNIPPNEVPPEDVAIRRKLWYTAHKSGLSPLFHPDSPFDMKNFPPATWLRDEHGLVQNFLHNYQKTMLMGFSSAALHRWDATNVDVKDPRGRLSNAIHPLLERHRWSLFNKIDPNDKETENVSEYWMIEDGLWTAIEPALVLLTNYLTHSCCVPWIDACLNSPRELIGTAATGQTDVEGGVKWMLPHRRFCRRRRREAAHTMVQSVKDELSKLTGKISWVISTEGMEHETVSYGGTNVMINDIDSSFDSFEVTISMRYIQSLLRPNQLNGERMLSLFELVVTMLHEMGHVFGLWEMITKEGLFMAYSAQRVREPFFEDELINEMGYSLVNQMMGGDTEAVNPHRAAASSIFATVQSPWPHPNGYSASGEYLHNTKKIFDEGYRDFWSVSMKWIEGLWSDEFWQDVRTYEGQSLRYRWKNGYRRRPYVDAGQEKLEYINANAWPLSLQDSFRSDAYEAIEKVHRANGGGQNRRRVPPIISQETGLQFADENRPVAIGLIGMAEQDRRTWGLPPGFQMKVDSEKP